MATTTANNKTNLNPRPQINSVPNLRLLCKQSESANTTTSAAIYRSARPDFITAADLEEFDQLGIKCMIDFRSFKEYNSTVVGAGHRLLDEDYVQYQVVIPKTNYKQGQAVTYELVSQKRNTSSSPDDEHFSSSTKSKNEFNFENDGNGGNGILNKGGNQAEKRHYFINFFTSSYVKILFHRLPWHLWCLGILHLVWDIITWNHLKTFRKFITKKSINSVGLFGQYVDLIEVSQPSICSALKLISDPENLPVLINCAYGKDRTGIISALILMLLGMPKDYIAEEYAMSTAGLEPIRHQLYTDVVVKHHLVEEFCWAKASIMRDLITYIEDRYKSVEQYMTYIGFTEEEQARLRSSLDVVCQESCP